jgi:hypothetical protein
MLRRAQQLLRKVTRSLLLPCDAVLVLSRVFSLHQTAIHIINQMSLALGVIVPCSFFREGPSSQKWEKSDSLIGILSTREGIYRISWSQITDFLYMSFHLVPSHTHFPSSHMRSSPLVRCLPISVQSRLMAYLLW